MTEIKTIKTTGPPSAPEPGLLAGLIPSAQFAGPHVFFLDN